MVKTAIDLTNRTLKDYEKLIEELNFMKSVLDADHLLREGAEKVNYRLTYFEHEENFQRYLCKEMADIIINFINNEPEKED